MIDTSANRIFSFKEHQQRKQRIDTMRAYHLKCASDLNSLSDNRMIRQMVKTINTLIESMPYEVWGGIAYSWKVKDEPFEACVNYHYVNKDDAFNLEDSSSYPGVKYASVSFRKAEMPRFTKYKESPLDALIKNFKAHGLKPVPEMTPIYFLLGVLVGARSVYARFNCTDNEGEIKTTLCLYRGGFKIDLMVDVTALKNHQDI